jgi:hypothetical protein
VEDTINCLRHLLDGVNSRKKVSFCREIVKEAQEVAKPIYLGQIFSIKVDRLGEAHILNLEDGLRFIISLTFARLTPKPDTIKLNILNFVDMLERITEPKSIILTKTQVSDLISQAQRIRAVELINHWHPLFVVIIPKSDKELNSFYLPYINTIVVTAPDPERGNAEYVFLHDVGHALHMALTKNIEEIPQSFLPVFKVAFGTHPSKVNHKDWPDIFADSFTIAVSYKTPLHKTNPFCQEFADLSLAALATYFKLLILANMDEDLSKAVDMDWTTERFNLIKKSIEVSEE